MITISFPGGVAVEAVMKGHSVLTDQPPPLGRDAAPAPLDLFFISLGTCMGYYALRFCQERNIATEGLALTLDVVKDGKRVSKIMTALELPPAFPEKYNDAICRAIGHCAVKQILDDPPEIELSVEYSTAIIQ